MDFDYAHYMLTEGRKDKENPAVSSPSRDAYRKQLAETFNMNRTRILAFKNKPPTPVEAIPNDYSAIQQSKPTKPRRHIPQVHGYSILGFWLYLWLVFTIKIERGTEGKWYEDDDDLYQIWT